MRKYLAASATAVALAVSIVNAPAASAQKVVRVDQAENIAFGWTFRSAPLHTCTQIKITAKVVYTKQHAYRQDTYPTIPEAREIKNARLFNPTMSAHTYVLDSRGGCTSTPKKVASMALTQGWVGARECSLNPSISVGGPWSVAVGFWPTCGQRKAGVSTTLYGANTVFNQYNTNGGAPTVVWPYLTSQVGSGLPAVPCLAAHASVSVNTGRDADNFGIEDSSVKSYCLHPNWTGV